jgi:hypothetical protein
MVVGLVCFNDPPSYTGGSIASVRAPHARQICGEKPDEKAIHWSSRIAGGWA